MRGARGGGRGAGGEPLAIGGHLWILSQGAKGGGRRVEEGGNRYQTINADHHDIGGSTAVLLVEHRVGASGKLSALSIALMGPKKCKMESGVGWDGVGWP